MRKLSTDQYGKDNYDSGNIKLYLEQARVILKEDENAYIVISDLCAGNIEWGDVIVKRETEIQGVEFKENTPKNRAIINAIHSDGEISFNSKYDQKQYERFLRQENRMNHISSRLQATELYNTDNGIAVPVLIPWMKDYSDQFKSICMDAENHFFQRLRIDDCIQIFTINKKYMESFLSDNDDKVLSLWKNNKWLSNEMLEHKNYSDIIYGYKEEYILESYNSVLEDAFFPQPYAFDIDKKIIRYILTGEVQIITAINLELVFSSLREHGYKVYSKKGHTCRTDFLYKNKRWIIEDKNGHKLFFSRMFITRIAYTFYSTNTLISFVEMLFQFLPPAELV